MFWYPAPLRDLLIELASQGLYRPKWSAQIHQEWTRNLLERRPDLTEAQLHRTCELINTAVPDSLITGYHHLTVTVDLPDDDDRHVIAAAIHANADAIVTINLRDFPPETLAVYNLEAIHPDEFLVNQFELDEAAVVTAARGIRTRLTRPPLDAAAYPAKLETIGLTRTLDVLRPYLGVL